MARPRPCSVRAEIVHDDDVGRRSDEDLVDVEADVSPSIARRQPWRLDPVVPQGGEERHRPPVAVRHLAAGARRARPAPERSHVGLGPGLVDEDEAVLIYEPLPRCPFPSRATRGGPVRPQSASFFITELLGVDDSHT